MFEACLSFRKSFIQAQVSATPLCRAGEDLEGCIGLPAMQSLPCPYSFFCGQRRAWAPGISVYLVYRVWCYLMQYACPIVLFYIHREKKKCITKNTVSLWLRSVSNRVYKSALDDNCTAANAKTHRVRSIGAKMLGVLGRTLQSSKS